MFNRKKSSDSSIPSPTQGGRKSTAKWRPRGTSTVYVTTFDGSSRQEALNYLGRTTGLVLPGENPHDHIEVIEVDNG